VGTHVLKVKNVGTVELNGSPRRPTQDPYVRRPRGPVKLKCKNVGAVELMGKNSMAPSNLKTHVLNVKFDSTHVLNVKFNGTHVL
jgi:hypothetical protein